MNAKRLLALVILIGFAPAAVIAADTNYLTASNTGTLTVLPLVSTKSVGSDAVGSGATATVTFTISSGGTVGAPVVLTQGATGKDFTDAGTGTCTSNGTSHVYSAGATCTVVVKFAPLYPGLRMGAVQLTNSSGAVFATVYLSATGSGPRLQTPSIGCSIKWKAA